MKTIFVTMLVMLSVAQVSRAYADANDVLNFTDAFRKKYGNVLKGQTTDGKACKLEVWDYSSDLTSCGSSSFNRDAYVSLGTSSDGSEKPSSFTHIGTFINPNCTLEGEHYVKVMEATSTLVHFDVVQDEAFVKDVENDLRIKLDRDGNVIEAQGSSSYWPSSVCLFNK